MCNSNKFVISTQGFYDDAEKARYLFEREINKLSQKTIDRAISEYKSAQIDDGAFDDFFTDVQKIGSKKAWRFLIAAERRATLKVLKTWAHPRSATAFIEYTPA